MLYQDAKQRNYPPDVLGPDKVYSPIEFVNQITKFMNGHPIEDVKFADLPADHYLVK